MDTLKTKPPVSSVFEFRVFFISSPAVLPDALTDTSPRRDGSVIAAVYDQRRKARVFKALGY
jgi:hypothetical protein